MIPDEIIVNIYYQMISIGNLHRDFVYKIIPDCAVLKADYLKYLNAKIIIKRFLKETTKTYKESKFISNINSDQFWLRFFDY